MYYPMAIITRFIINAAIGFCFLYFSCAANALIVTRGPYLQTGTDSSITVKWRTDINTDSRVSYGTAPGLLTSYVDVSTLTGEHEVQITGLIPSSTYYYSFGSTSQVLGGDDADHFFITPPAPGVEVPVRVWVIGDSGSANSNAAAVRNAYLAFNNNMYTNLWLMLGDNAYNDGTDNQYQAAVFDMYPSILMQTVLWPTLGNHDGISADSDTQTGVYYDIFTLPVSGEAGGMASGTEAYYSFDYSNIHFVCLDSHESDRSSAGAMLTWLENDLASTTQKWIIAFWHHPPYSKGSHDSDTEPQLIDMRVNALPILESYGVDMVLSGHSHSYERSFQLDGHYGFSSTLTGEMIIDSGSGRIDVDGTYIKDGTGTVYVVAGASGMTTGGSLDHLAMFLSLNRLGSLVLDVDGNWLDAVYINESGDTEDYFSILKLTQGNLPPVVSAGADNSVILPSGISLNGTVSDDGLPDPPGTLIIEWSLVSGPGTVTFDDSTAIDTTATFSAAGSYILQLSAFDGDVSITDDVSIQVYPEGTINQPPTVNAGPDLTARASGASLSGSASDDGLPYPPGTFITTWIKIGGPGTVTFADAGSQVTSVQFSEAGTYVLRLTADDGLSSTSDDMTVSVYNSFSAVDISVNSSSDDAEESSSGSMYLDSSDLEFTFDQSNQTVGMRFTDIGIPFGSIVFNAYVQFKVDEANSVSTALTIKGEYSDDALAFGTANGNITSRSRTGASVPWSPPEWTTPGEAGPDQRTPDISSIIQEIINRPGWSSGNSIAIIIDGTGERTAESYNGDPTGAPMLYIEYMPACQEYYVRNASSSIVYNSIQTAYNTALPLEMLQVQEGTVVDDIILNIDKEITIRGGYDCSYIDVSGESIINGTLTINNGLVTLENLRLE